MSKAKNIIALLLKEEFEILIPFENLTKADVAAINPFPELFRVAHSCIGSRWIESGHTGRTANDGTCYGCVVRMLGLITAGIDDVDYEHNPIVNQYSNADNLLNVLAFSTEVILDYDGIDLFSREIIDEYRKKDLFVRFALDNIAALHILIGKGLSLNPLIMNHYFDVKNSIGTGALEKRIADVRRIACKPDFKRSVK
jgi:hypothetical protein